MAGEGTGVLGGLGVLRERNAFHFQGSQALYVQCAVPAAQFAAHAGVQGGVVGFRQAQHGHDQQVLALRGAGRNDVAEPVRVVNQAAVQVQQQAFLVVQQGRAGVVQVGAAHLPACRLLLRQLLGGIRVGGDNHVVGVQFPRRGAHRDLPPVRGQAGDAHARVHVRPGRQLPGHGTHAVPGQGRAAVHQHPEVVPEQPRRGAQVALQENPAEERPEEVIQGRVTEPLAFQVMLGALVRAAQQLPRFRAAQLQRQFRHAHLVAERQQVRLQGAENAARIADGVADHVRLRAAPHRGRRRQRHQVKAGEVELPPHRRVSRKKHLIPGIQLEPVDIIRFHAPPDLA